MIEISFKIWFGIGLFLMIGEFLLPGLVIVFIGMGCMTVAAGLYWNLIGSIPSQIITFFVSSLIYLLTLRFLVLKLIPTDTAKVNINEDKETIGQIVKVTSTIPSNGVGRISYSGTTWQAKNIDHYEILKDQKVKIVRRENITWVVEKII